MARVMNRRVARTRRSQFVDGVDLDGPTIYGASVGTKEIQDLRQELPRFVH